MAFEVQLITLQPLDYSGQLISSPTTLDGATPYTRLAIGQRLRLSLNLGLTTGASGSLDGKEISINAALFGQLQRPSSAYAQGYRIAISTQPVTEGIPQMGAANPQNDTAQVRYLRYSASNGTLEYDFMVLHDMLGYAPVRSLNADKLRTDRATSSVLFDSQGGTVFTSIRYLQVWVRLNGMPVPVQLANYYSAEGFAQPCTASFYDAGSGGGPATRTLQRVEVVATAPHQRIAYATRSLDAESPLTPDSPN